MSDGSPNRAYARIRYKGLLITDSSPIRLCAKRYLSSRVQEDKPHAGGVETRDVPTTKRQKLTAGSGRWGGDETDGGGVATHRDDASGGTALWILDPPFFEGTPTASDSTNRHYALPPCG
jgi:hypothetical protein